MKTNGPNVLYAWDANDLTNTIYESDTNPQRDVGGIANRFTIPVVTNGKVYVSAQQAGGCLWTFECRADGGCTANFPGRRHLLLSQSVTLSSTTASAEIHYTLNGTTPTSSSTLYNAPITIATNTTVNAVASATGYLQSAMSSATFIIGVSGSCSAPTSAGVHLCSPTAGSSVSSPVMVQATAKVTGTIASTQLWVDGVKKYSTTSSSLNTSISLAAGSHRFAVLAVNTAGQKWESVANATVQ